MIFVVKLCDSLCVACTELKICHFARHLVSHTLLSCIVGASLNSSFPLFTAIIHVARAHTFSRDLIAFKSNRCTAKKTATVRGNGSICNRGSVIERILTVTVQGIRPSPRFYGVLDVQEWDMVRLTARIMKSVVSRSGVTSKCSRNRITSEEEILHLEVQPTHRATVHSYAHMFDIHYKCIST